MNAEKESQSNGAGSPDKPACFVIMPISDPDGYEKGHFKHVYEDIFIPACDKAGYKAIRADDVREANLIHLDILQKLIDSPMAICDLSGRNPNALFELGVRQAFDKPVVLVQEIGTAPIFDIGPLRYIEYSKQLIYRQVLEDQNKIAETIKATQTAAATGQSVNSIVKLLSLTSPASLTTISDTEKENGLLQVIMAELGNIRSEFKAATKVTVPSNTREGWKPEALVNSSEAKLRDRINNIQRRMSYAEDLLAYPASRGEIKDVHELLRTQLTLLEHDISNVPKDKIMSLTVDSAIHTREEALDLIKRLATHIESASFFEAET